jgi:hypothetical protein
MIQTTPEGLVALAATGIPLEPPPTEAQIDDFLNRMAAVFSAPADVVAEARKLVHARFKIRMELGETLKSDKDHALWLDARRASIDPFYWDRYRQFLIRGGWAPRVTATLDRATDEILNLLGNPGEKEPWKRRGLVVGDVQSGKTATYAAVIAKAADAGYRMVVLLTGTLENVRRQTQERLDFSFVGFDSSDFLSDAKIQRKRHVGVGLIDGRRDGVVFTSMDHDFRKATVSALNISLSTINEPVLVVTKKNKAVLERLAAWLRAKNANGSGRIELPLLLIDDEADNASINTKKDPAKTTAINQAIRDLLGLFERSSYVGFTATPFANIFIDPSSTDAMLGDDLFPSDFIHVLRPPDNYIGMDRVFPAFDADDEVDGNTEEADRLIRTVRDADDWLPGDHDKDADPGPMPDSLRQALHCFVLTCAIRDLRAAAGTAGRGGGIHRSMLVNVSRFTAVQNRVADTIQLELEDLRTAIRLYGKLPAADAASRSARIADLSSTFASEFAASGFAWPEVLSVLLEAMAPIRIQPVNQVTGGKSLDYGKIREAPGVRVVAVGGNSLSRGLTLEGLSTSYFLRESRAYDTLLQMGRWFGYRDGYDDLCRLWMTTEIRGWYQLITQATAELKRDFARMTRRQATPEEFGLRVRSHPGTLLITARNKMASGMDVEMQRDISVQGRMVETPTLYSDRRRNEENVRRLDRFLIRIQEAGSPAATSPHEGALIWEDVPAEMVADVLADYLVHPLNFDFQGDALADFVRSAATGEDRVATWTVAMPTSGDGGLVSDFTALAGHTIQAAARRIKTGRTGKSLQVSGKSARVGGRSDLRHAFSSERYKQLKSEHGDLKEDTIRQEMLKPLLIIYPLRGKAAEAASEDPASFYRGGLLLPAMGIHFPGEIKSGGSKAVVRYRINKVAQAELFPEQGDDDDEADDLDESD